MSRTKTFPRPHFQPARPRRTVHTMSVATVAALRVPASLARFSHRAGRRASCGARHPLSVRAAGKDPSPEEEDDLPEPIKLTPEQAKVAALAFDLLYEKDPVEELEDMLVDRERPELRAKLQRAIEGARPDTSTARARVAKKYLCSFQIRRQSR